MTLKKKSFCLENNLFSSLIHRIFFTSQKQFQHCCSIHCALAVVHTFISSHLSSLPHTDRRLFYLDLVCTYFFPQFLSKKNCMIKVNQAYKVVSSCGWIIVMGFCAASTLVAISRWFSQTRKKTSRISWIFLISLFLDKTRMSKENPHNLLVPGKTKPLSYTDSIHQEKTIESAVQQMTFHCLLLKDLGCDLLFPHYNDTISFPKRDLFQSCKCFQY